MKEQLECPARGCSNKIMSRILVCNPHWFMIPGDIRKALWREYREGEAASPEYLRLAIDAINIIARTEGRKPLPEVNITEAQNVQQCDDCGEIKELRPYGPGGSVVCFDCMMKDEEGAEKRFLEGFR